MTTKLTLSVEKSVVERAKELAKGSQRSLSEIVGKYLENLDGRINNEKLTSTVDRLAGSLPLPKDFDEKKALDDYYKEKYGLDELFH